MADEIILNPEVGVVWRRVLGDDRIVDVMPMLGSNARIGVGPPGEQVYDDVWCYSSLAKAISHAALWDGEGEPDGWHRHPSTGRRRENGDPAKEQQWW